MKKFTAMTAACAIALGLSACAAPAEEETAEAPAVDGTMSEDAAAEAAADSGEEQGETTDGLDQDGNPIHN